MYVWNLVLFFSPVNVIKSFMSISDENLKSELTNVVSLFQRLGMKTFKIPLITY